MGKFTVLEYTDPAGDCDVIQVDLSQSVDDITKEMAYQVAEHLRGWTGKYGPTGYFYKRFPMMVAVVVDAKRRQEKGLPIDELTLIDVD